MDKPTEKKTRVLYCDIDGTIRHVLLEGKRGWPNSGHRNAQQKAAQISIKDGKDGFEKQKLAFKSIPTQSLEPFLGQFVVSRNGTVVDHDTDLVALNLRVIERYGNLPVYITRLGKKAKMPTPFVVR